VSAFCSMFSQLLKLFPRTEFQGLVTRTHAERHARGFTCWGQFVAMLFCQLGRAHSYIAYYNTARPHQSLDNNSPQPREVHPPELGRVVSIPQVGGLHHLYQRAA
jgi:transposase InsO family protein